MTDMDGQSELLPRIAPPISVLSMTTLCAFVIVNVVVLILQLSMVKELMFSYVFSDNRKLLEGAMNVKIVKPIQAQLNSLSDS